MDLGRKNYAIKRPDTLVLSCCLASQLRHFPRAHSATPKQFSLLRRETLSNSEYSDQPLANVRRWRNQRRQRQLRNGPTVAALDRVLRAAKTQSTSDRGWSRKRQNERVEGTTPKGSRLRLLTNCCYRCCRRHLGKDKDLAQLPWHAETAITSESTAAWTLWAGGTLEATLKG